MNANEGSVYRREFRAMVEAETDRALAKHGNAPWSRHEFYAILLEEVDELWEEVKTNGAEHRVESELVQIAAVCLRYYESRGGA